MKSSFVKVASLAALLVAAAASAQQYPSKPIHIVVGFPPGGGNDIVARLLGAKMQENWGQPVVIDNKPGANSIIAAEFVAKAPPDGYTLLVNATGGMSVNPAVYAKLPYRSPDDFVPISDVGTFPLILAVNPSLPVKTAEELIAYARSNPGRLNYSSGSTAFQVATEMFKQMTGTDIRHIPYKGSAASINAVLAGDVQMTIVDSPPALPHVKSGQIRGLAVTSARRVASMPDLPALGEAAVPGYEMNLWIGVFTPAGTPRDVVARLNAEVVRIVNLPDVREKFAGMGVQPVGDSSEDFTRMIRAEIERFRPVVKAANIKAD